MALKLNKTITVIGILAILVLSGALGYLIWRTNQPEPLASTDSEAASGLCGDADYVIDVSKVVCGDGCFKGSPVSLCPPKQTFTLPVPAKGTFTVKGIVGRGHCDANGKNCQCQDNEEFYIVLAGKKGKVAKDDHLGTSGCGVTTVVQELGKFDLEVKSYSVQMISAAPKCANKGDYPANSVNLNKICLYAVPVCGDGTKNGTEACDPAATPTGCNTGEKCLDDCTCAAVLKGELSLSKKVIESCIDEGTANPKANLTYTITVTNGGTGIANISSMVDSLDPKVLSAGLTPSDISDGGIYSSGSINWPFTEASPITVNAGETRTYTYKLLVDKSNFGTYENRVTLLQSSGGDEVAGVELTANATVTADCELTTTPPVVPQTGIFDSTLGRIGAGLALVIFGGIVYSIPNRVLVVKEDGDRYKYRGRFEKKVANR